MIIKEKTTDKIKSCEDVYQIFTAILQAEHETDQKKEHFWVMGMNANNSIEYIELAMLGILNTSPVHPREVFRLAIMKAVNSIIIVHNHPSGNPKPSESDKEITKTLCEAGGIIGIQVVDHIIIGEENYYSFASHYNCLNGKLDII